MLNPEISTIVHGFFFFLPLYCFFGWEVVSKRAGIKGRNSEVNSLQKRWCKVQNEHGGLSSKIHPVSNMLITSQNLFYFILIRFKEIAISFVKLAASTC